MAEPTEPRTTLGRYLRQLRRMLIGRPLRTAEEAHERLTKVKALAILSSDAISSTAYATEEIMLILVLAGSVAYNYLIPIGLAIAALLVIVALSYRQTIFAYPMGGGSYIVTKDNLGTTPSLIAGTSLLIDYTLTVAVSISSGVAAITSAIPELIPFRVELAVAAIVLLVIGNLRGIRESGSIFAIPTYLFIGGMMLLLGLGAGAAWFGLFTPHPVSHPIPPAQQGLSLFLILRAFASGCTALTGVEAISDGVPAFQPPEARNAARTLVWMTVILGTIFLGITFLAYHFHLTPTEEETILSQLARTIVGDSPLYYYIQATTAGILLLAANTSFADFPRLASFMARDRYLPTQFRFRGDRLAFSTGIIALGLAAGTLVILFGASVNALIPLYAVGVFSAFTLSQASMTRRWWRREPPSRHRTIGMLINGTGAVTTGIVTLIIIVTKFLAGAWVILVVQPLLIWQLRKIHRHYERVSAELSIPPGTPAPERPGWPGPLTVVVPIAGYNRAALQAIEFAREIAADIRVVHVTDDPAEAEQLRRQWRDARLELPLVIIESPYRELIGPLVSYIEQVHTEKGDVVMVVVPEFVPAHLHDLPLHTQTAWRLRLALWTHPGIIVTSVPYHVSP
ncbi:MAG: APC family permease [Sphaerobacter sp.]|nr:APC family permease [Sphaerobacter sp.]MDI3341389.1 APC family permease [Sphaerobacter sp.]